MLKSSSIAAITTEAFSGPGAGPLADGFYEADDSVLTSNFKGPGSDDPINRAVKLGSAGEGRERGLELLFWSDDSADDDIVLHIYHIERVAPRITDAASLVTYLVRKLGTITATVGTAAVDGLGIPDNSSGWIDTLGAFTPTAYGTAQAQATQADPVPYSPGSNGVASLILPDVGSAFAVGVVPATGTVGIAAKRVT